MLGFIELSWKLSKIIDNYYFIFSLTVVCSVWFVYSLLFLYNTTPNSRP